MLFDASGGRSSSASIPSRPAASIAANARYGVGRAVLDPRRLLLAWLVPRDPDERRAVPPGPAHVDGRLEAGDEALVGVHLGVHPLIRDERDLRRVREDPGDGVLRELREVVLVVLSKKAFRSPENSDWCVCIPLPFTPSTGFGMNVA